MAFGIVWTAWIALTSCDQNRESINDGGTAQPYLRKRGMSARKGRYETQHGREGRIWINNGTKRADADPKIRRSSGMVVESSYPD